MPAIFPTTEPNIALRVLPKIPATLQGASGLSVVKVNGIWTVAPQWETLPVSTPTDLANTEVWIRNSVSGAYSRMPLSVLTGYVMAVSGVPSGTPTVPAGTVALRYDTVGNRLYAFNGTWKSVALT